MLRFELIFVHYFMIVKLNQFQDDETQYGQYGAAPKRCIQRDWTNFNISNNFESTPRRRQWRKPVRLYNVQISHNHYPVGGGGVLAADL